MAQETEKELGVGGIVCGGSRDSLLFHIIGSLFHIIGSLPVRTLSQSPSRVWSLLGKKLEHDKA